MEVRMGGCGASRAAGVRPRDAAIRHGRNNGRGGGQLGRPLGGHCMSAESAGIRLGRSSNGSPGRWRLVVLCLTISTAILALPVGVHSAVGTSDEVHYTFTGPTSVAFDWRGTATDIRYGATTSYGSTATAQTPSPLPFSSTGPFEEVALTGLDPGATYHYSIGGGTDHTFTTAPTGNFVFD